MRKICLFAVLVVISSSCVNKQEKKIDLNQFIQFDEKTGVLKIKKDKRLLIKVVEINSSNYIRQKILLDTSNNIGVIENLVSIDGDPNYLNTWTSFDNESNFSHRESYYYVTTLANENGIAYVDCFLPNFMYDKPECYILLNSFDNRFETKKASDTLWFDENHLVRIPIKKYKGGLNNVKFIIVEEGFDNNKRKIKKTYVSKDFIVAKR